MWDPNHYLRFRDERTRPSVELATRIAVEHPKQVVDLGCGPGNSTQVLRRRWPSASVFGLDNSAAMIGSAQESFPDQEWVLGRIEDWKAAQPCDVVFSNAALQWVRDHAPLTQRLFDQVAPGGALAFQIPSGAYSPLRAAIEEISEDPAWTARMNEARTVLTMEPPHAYYDALAPRARSVDVWETEYHHVMESSAAIVDWISSTGLRPFLEVLESAADRQRFLDRLVERVRVDYPRRSDGRILFPFRRTFVIAYAQERASS